MKTTLLPEEPDAKSPTGADIRFLMDGETGNLIHSTVPPHQTNRATVHTTVSEFWFVLEGSGEIWRDDGVESCITKLIPGTAIDILISEQAPLCLRFSLYFLSFQDAVILSHTDRGSECN
jgi:hypothetical protein